MSSVHPEVFGKIITRSSGKPSAAERVTGWLRAIAPLRAAAEAGDDSAMECAPNVIPMRRPLSRMQTVRAALEDHCRLIGLSQSVAEDAIARCRFWLGQDLTLSEGELIRKGKVRCSAFHASGPKECA